MGKRTPTVILTSCIVLGVCVVQAQDVISPGSTVDGDYLRGQGVFLKGAAWYEIEASKARNLDAQTQILVDRYLRELYDTYQAERQARYGARAARTKASAEAASREYEKREVRLRTAPTDEDLASGAALNALLADLSDPAVNSWSKSMPDVPLPADVSIARLSFLFVPRKTSNQLKSCLIALGKLQEKWPVVLSDELAAKEKKVYNAAYQRIVEQCLADKLNPKSIDELDDAIKALRAKADEVSKARGFQATAVRFVNDLKEATRLFDGSSIDFAQEIIRDTHKHEAQTVGQLLAFMRKYRLMFTSAEKGVGGLDAYSKLYLLMREQKARMGISDVVLADGGWKPLFNGRNFNGWTPDRGHEENWRVENGEVVANGPDVFERMSYVLSAREYGDFEARFEFMTSPNSDSGFAFRAIPGDEMHHMEVTLNNFANVNLPLNGAILWSTDAAKREFPNPRPDMRQIGQWNDMRIETRGDRMRVWINGKQVQDVDLTSFKGQPTALSGLGRRSGRIGFQAHSGIVRFKNAEIRELRLE